MKGNSFLLIFIFPKKDGTYRLILNLKNLNDHVEYHHFKMDTLQSAIMQDYETELLHGFPRFTGCLLLGSH